MVYKRVLLIGLLLIYNVLHSMQPHHKLEQAIKQYNDGQVQYLLKQINGLSSEKIYHYKSLLSNKYEERYVDLFFWWHITTPFFVVGSVVTGLGAEWIKSKIHNKNES